MSSVQDELQPPEGYQFWNTIRFVRMGKLDPTVRRERNRLLVARWYGAASATLEVVDHGSTLALQAWGEGAAEALRAAPALLGLEDSGCQDFGDDRVNRLVLSLIHI